MLQVRNLKYQSTTKFGHHINNRKNSLKKMSRDCKKAGQSGSQQKVMVAVYNNGLRSSVWEPDQEDPSLIGSGSLLFTISKIQRNFRKVVKYFMIILPTVLDNIFFFNGHKNVHNEFVSRIRGSVSKEYGSADI
jgi:hypothetical protein